MLGQTYDNNKKEDKEYQPTVYSPYRMSNVEGIDPSALTFTFWAGILKISIAPANKTTNESVTFDYKNAGTAYLTHTKARILLNEILKFQENVESYNNVGVDVKGGLVSISNGKEFGITSPCLVIRKVNETTGAVESSYVYEFKTKYHYGIRNFDEKTSVFDTIFYDDIEIEQLKAVLEQYYTAMTYANAYSVVDSGKFENSRINTKIGLIAGKLGVEFKGGSSGGAASGGKSFFNNKGGSSDKNFSSGTIDDIVNQMD